MRRPLLVLLSSLCLLGPPPLSAQGSEGQPHVDPDADTEAPQGSSLHAQALRAEEEWSPGSDRTEEERRAEQQQALARALVLLRRSVAARPEEPDLESLPEDAREPPCRQGRCSAYELARVAVLAAALAHDRPDAEDVEPLLQLSPRSSEARLLRAYVLAEQFNVETAVATRGRPELQNEAPGVLTVISREQIRGSGAQDLIDVLSQVAGFAFGTDVLGTLSPGFRGMWGAEGKILVLLDGHEMHELSYLSNYFGNRFSLDWIERVEIVRGPGSVIYGGAAELAVISIVTRSAAAIDGVRGSALYGEALGGFFEGGQPLSKIFSRRNLSLSLGQTFPRLGNLSAKVDFFIGQGNRSDGVYTDLQGDKVALSGTTTLPDGRVVRNAATDPLMLNAQVDFKGFKFNYLFEDWRQTDRTGATEAVASRPLPIQWVTHSLQAEYSAQLQPGLRLVPYARYIWQNPWSSVGEDAAANAGGTWDPHVQRLRGGASLEWRPFATAEREGREVPELPLPGEAPLPEHRLPRPRARDLELLVGGEATMDRSFDGTYGYPAPGSNPLDRLRSIAFLSEAGFGQVVWNNPWVNLSAGARFERNNGAGSTFLPRAAVTRNFGRFYAKGLYSRAMRFPNIENLGLQEGIKPEKTTAIEAEVGALVTGALQLTLNAFDVSVDQAIVYGLDTTQVHTAEPGTYSNGGSLGTRGLEAQLRWKGARGFANLNYSFYTAAGRNSATTDSGQRNPYLVPGRDDVLLGFAPHKVAATGSYDVARNWSAGASLLVLAGPRYAFEGFLGPIPVLHRYPNEVLINLTATRRNLAFEGLYARLGLYNLLDRRQLYLRPYLSATPHGPVPGPSFEVALEVGYDPSR